MLYLNNRIASNAKYLRLKTGLLQKDVATYLGLKEVTYRQYENGKRNFPVCIMSSLINLYGITDNDFLYKDIELVNPTIDSNFYKVLNQNDNRFINIKNVKNETKNIIAYNLKRIRKSNNKTQLQVAKVLNISGGNYSRYETGQVTIDQNKIGKLAKFYNISILEFYKKA